MKEFIELGNPVTDYELSYDRPHYEAQEHTPDHEATEWVIDMIIADNEASSVNNALNHLGYDVTITRQTHWEIITSGERNKVLKRIDDTGELYNSNKEYISQTLSGENRASLLVRQKEDMHGRAKFESLTERFEIHELIKLKRGVIWNVSVNGGNFETVLREILNTHILYNPLSHECYRIN